MPITMSITDENTLRVITKLLEMQREEFQDSAMGRMTAVRRRNRKRQNRQLLGLGGTVGKDPTARRPKRRYRRDRRTQSWRDWYGDYDYGYDYGYDNGYGYGPYRSGYRSGRYRTSSKPYTPDWTNLYEQYQARKGDAGATTIDLAWARSMPT